MSDERRQHRRLAIHLPMECYPVESDREQALRTTTRNISTGGLYFEVDLLDEVPVPQLHSLLSVGLTVPPGDGYFPYDGRVTGVAEVVRFDQPDNLSSSRSDTPPRLGVGARFREPLRLAF